MPSPGHGSKEFQVSLVAPNGKSQEVLVQVKRTGVHLHVELGNGRLQVWVPLRSPCRGPLYMHTCAHKCVCVCVSADDHAS